MATGLSLPKFLTTWRIPGFTQGVSCTKKNPCKDAKAKGIKMMRMPHPSQGSIFLRKVLENHGDIQLVGLTPSLGHG